jgi:thiol:disulfide interchange protein DsbC
MGSGGNVIASMIYLPMAVKSWFVQQYVSSLMKKLILPLVLFLLFSPLGLAASDGATVDSAVVKKIERVMGTVMPAFQVESIKSSVIDGLYEVKIKNGPLLMSTADADYFISGDLYTTVNGEIENVSEIDRKKDRLRQVEAFDKDELIVFSPKGKAARWIAVFTDIQCGYCRKFHGDVPALNDMGIEVRYFSYPIFDGSRDKMVSALCSKDRQQALTTLKSGGSIPAKDCAEQSIDAQAALAKQFGISGTPAIMLDDGTLLKGYVEPKQLAQQMGM